MTPKRWIHCRRLAQKDLVNFMNRISLFKTRIVIEDKVYLLAKDVRKALGYKSVDQLQSEHSEIVKHKDVEDAGVDLLSCNAPGISFYISQAEVIKLLNPNMYRDIVLIDGDMDFAYSKTVTKDALIE